MYHQYFRHSSKGSLLRVRYLDLSPNQESTTFNKEVPSQTVPSTAQVNLPYLLLQNFSQLEDSEPATGISVEISGVQLLVCGSGKPTIQLRATETVSYTHVMQHFHPELRTVPALLCLLPASFLPTNSRFSTRQQSTQSPPLPPPVS